MKSRGESLLEAVAAVREYNILGLFALEILAETLRTFSSKAVHVWNALV